MHSHIAKMIGTYIYESRMKKKILQYELAKKLKMTGQFLGRIEKGEVMIPEGALVKCINILSLKEDVLLKIYRTSGELQARDILSMSKSAPTRKMAENE